MARTVTRRVHSPTHVWIPDTQVEPGRPIDHLRWIGQYLEDRWAGLDLVVQHAGDHWNMGSLSSYDKGRGKMEGRRVKADIDAGNEAFDLLNPAKRTAARKWRRIRHLGNHEDRITRAIESDVQLDGVLSLDHLDTPGWEVPEYLEPVEIDGVRYAHYFYNPNTGRPYAGANLETRLKQVGCSFTMGHQQGRKWGQIDGIAGPNIGLVAGSCYLHDEDYLGPQSINYWRGIVVCHNVVDGNYDPMFVGLDYLCKRYENKPLRLFVPRRFA